MVVKSASRMSSKSKKKLVPKRCRNLVGQDQQAKRFVLNPQNVRQLDEAQVRKVVEEAGLPLDEKKIASLRSNINAHLKWIVPRLKNAGQTDIDGLREAVKALKRKLHPDNRRLLNLIASAVGGHFQPRSGDIGVERELRRNDLSISEINRRGIRLAC